MNLLDINFNFHDFISESKWSKSDLKYLAETLKQMKDADLITLYNDLHNNEKDISEHNRELMNQMKKELSERGFTFDQFSNII